MLTLDLAPSGAARRGLYAAYLLADGEPALVDCGAGSHLPALHAALAGHGLTVGGLRHVFLTHVHLDHAGAAGALVAENPRLEVWVHERGARHLIDPSRLVASARTVFGERHDQLWGEMLPVPAERVRAIAADGPLPVARSIEAILAPGHARHEIVYALEDGTLVAGDVCGVAFDGHRFLDPPTPPPDVDVGAWLRTLDAVEARAPARVALGHFGVFDDPLEALAGLRASLHRRAAWAADDEASYAAHVRRELAEAMGADAVDAYHDDESIATDYAGLRRWWEREHGR